MIGQCYGNGALFDIGVGATCASNVLHKVSNVQISADSAKLISSLTYTVTQSTVFTGDGTTMLKLPIAWVATQGMGF